jgi:hypothetical protein
MLTAWVLCLSLQGFEIGFPLREETLLYKLRGGVLRTYYGGINAPVLREATITGTLQVRIYRQNEEWLAEGFLRNAKVEERGKPASSEVVNFATRGLWRGVLFQREWRFLVEGKETLPSALGAPWFPLIWAPFRSPGRVRVQDVITIPWSLPLQAFLEDDPIGSLEVPLTLRFMGLVRREGVPGYQFRYETVYSIRQAVKHPEDPNLTLRGEISLKGDFVLARSDARLEHAFLLWQLDLTLEGAGYPFGFSRCRASVSSVLERMR